MATRTIRKAASTRARAHNANIQTAPGARPKSMGPRVEPEVVDPFASAKPNYSELVDDHYNPTDASLSSTSFGFTYTEGFVLDRETGFLQGGRWHRDESGTPERQWHGHDRAFSFPAPLDGETMKRVAEESREDLGILVASYESEWDGQNFKARSAKGLEGEAQAAVERIEERLEATEELSEGYQQAAAEADAEEIQARIDNGELLEWAGIPEVDGLDAAEQVRFQLRDFADEYDDEDYAAIAEEWSDNLAAHVDRYGTREDSFEGLLIENDEAFELAVRDTMNDAIQAFDAGREE